MSDLPNMPPSPYQALYDLLIPADEGAEQYTIELKKDEILEIHKSLFKENNANIILNPM